ncbi:TonB-dependent receptor plug domain-containing protein [Thiomicrorhabdus lithotrophica]|uniref:TonB-dependent receptor n=1 Tax=Thiomicrorhabdus lithotrophica TaxID=2949997 RepID=A0ABY8CC35_9GAMM|nr:TonB-dependent receptor [Thiomicrorhabdus lithotrophica]WEJ63561.1 TonB-dependent receptor [Thiomicrorhabdus lithotrophica]
MKLSKLSSALLLAITSSSQTVFATELNDIIVSANHIDMSAHAVTADSTIITAEEIAENHYRTLDDALKQIPGISVLRNGGLGNVTSIIMRGQSNKDVLILVNGIEMNNTMGTGGALISHLLISDIERIEVLKGAQSGIWGANASAGVINIITKKASTGTQGNVNIELGSNAYKKISASLSSATDEGDFALSFSNIDTDGFSSVKVYKTNVNDFESDAFTQTDFSLDMGINLNDTHRIEVLVKNANSTANYDYASNPDQVASVDYQNVMKRLQYLYKQDNLNTKLFITQNEISQYSDAVINSFGVKGGYNYQKNQSLAFIASNNQYENLGTGESYYNTGLGLTNTNQFNNNQLIITESLRSDSYNQFEDKVTGKLGIKNYFNQDVFISANYGTAYNAPTLFQLTYGATSNLNPEETQSFDLNLGAYGFDITYYQAATKNLISYGGLWPNDYYYNLTGTSRFEGIDASYQLFIESMETQLGLTYSLGTAKDDNNEWLARRAEQTIALNLSYEGFKDLTLKADTRYIGKMYDKANQQGANIGDYFVTDLSVNYQATPNLTVYANVLNAFDEDYTLAVATYQADGITPKNVYANGGRQLFVGIQGSL